MSRPDPAPHAPRRSRRRRIALTVWLVALVALAVPTVVAAVGYASQPPDQRVPAAGGQVTIEEPGEYAVYVEGSSPWPASFEQIASITAPSGATVGTTPPRVLETYRSGSRYGTRIATFTASETGVHGVVGNAGTSAPGDELVVSTRTVGAILGVVGGSVATGVVLVVGLVGGLVTLLAGRRRLPPPPPYGPPAGGPAEGPTGPVGRNGPRRRDRF